MQENNKRIARNTLIVYARLIVTTIIGLFSSRFVLQILGVSDYGLYNVVAAVITMFSFLTSSLSSTSVRFINFEQGRNNGDVNKVFNECLVLHILFAIGTLIVLESLGIFYIHNYLNVPIGREADAMFVFQVSTIVACIGIITVPYCSLFVVFEKFSIIAIYDIVFAILKFLAIILLLYYEGDALRIYAVSMALLSLMGTSVFVLLSLKTWPEILKWRLVGGKANYKEMFVFNNYSLLSTTALMIRNQGSNMLINYFFGTIVNAAYAVSFSVQNYIISFVGNFDSASSPQITQNIGSGNKERSFFLTTYTCRICILLTLLLLFPIFYELDFILHLWLGKNVPEGANVFCKCTLLVALVSSTSGGITQLINATGKLKWFVIQYSVLYVFALFVGILLYGIGFPPYTIILLYFVADVISRFNQLYLLHKYINLDLLSFFRGAYMKPLIVLICGFAYLLFNNLLMRDSTVFHLCNLGLSFLYMACIIFFLGLYKNERELLLSYVSRKMRL